MSYRNGISYTDFRAINLKAEGGIIRFEDITTVPTTTTGEMLLYADGTTLYFDNGSTITAIGAAGASPGVSWESMYLSDNTINLAGGNGLSIAGSMSNSNDVLTLTDTAAGSGNVLQISNSGSGNDIRGTSGSWSVTKAGVATFAELVLTSTVATDVFAVTNNTITANNAFIVSGSGTFTGTGANSFANVTASGLTTGTALTVIANAATTSVGVFDVSATSMSSGSTVRVTGGGANITSGGKVVEIAMGAATTGTGLSVTTSGTHQGTTTNSLAVLNSAGDTGTVLYIVDNSLTTGVAQLITSSGTMVTAGSLLTLTANSATTAAGILRLNANGLTSGIGAVITSSATAITGAGRLLLVDHTGATSTSGSLVEFKTAATDETTVVTVTTAAMVDGVGLQLTGTTGMTTGSLLRATTSTAGLLATNGVYSLRGTGAHTSTSQTGLLDVRSSGLVGTAANGTLVNFHTTSAAQVDVTVLNVEASGFTTGYTGSMLRIKNPTTTGACKVVDLLADGITSGGTAMDISTDALTTGIALNIANSGGAMTSGSLLRVAAQGTGAIATNGIVSFTHTGDFTSTSAVDGGFVEIKANDTLAGTVFNLVADALTTGIGMQLSNATSGITSGSLLRVTGSGTGTLATNGLVSITHGGIFVSTANAGVLDVRASAMVGTASNGTLVNFMTTAAAQVDTTVLNVENSGFTTGYTGSMLRIKSPTTTGACKVVDLLADGITSGGTAMDISTDALTTGIALNIANSGGAMTTGSLLRVTAQGTGAIATNGIVSFVHTGAFTSTTVGFVNILTAGVVTGTVTSITANALTTGTALLVSSSGTMTSAGEGLVNLVATGLTTGSALKIDLTEATLTTGFYINCYDDTAGASVFSVGENGAILFSDLTEVVTATNVITAAESGSVFFLNSATEFVSTLPAVQAGLHFTFIVTAAPSGASYTVVTATSANVILGTVHSSDGVDGDSELTGADTVNFVDGAAVVGDRAEFWCDGTNWFVIAHCNVSTGITITTAS